jgi:hypothetical protein
MVFMAIISFACILYSHVATYTSAVLGATSGNMTSGNMTSGNMTSGNMTSGNMTSGNMTTKLEFLNRILR